MTQVLLHYQQAHLSVIAFAAVLACTCCQERSNPSRSPPTEVVYLLDLSAETSRSSIAIRAMA